MYQHENISSIENILELKRKHTCTTLEAIIMYCEELNLDIDEFGEQIKKDKQFFEMIKIDAIENNQLRESDGWKKQASLSSFFGD